MKKIGLGLAILLFGFVAGMAVGLRNKNDLETRLADQQTLVACASANASLLNDAELYLRFESSGPERVREDIKKSIRSNFMNIRYRDTYQHAEFRQHADKIRAETQKKLLDIFPEFKTRVPADESVD